jgi:hypothetical protein
MWRCVNQHESLAQDLPLYSTDETSYSPLPTGLPNEWNSINTNCLMTYVRTDIVLYLRRTAAFTSSVNRRRLYGWAGEARAHPYEPRAHRCDAIGVNRHQVQIFSCDITAVNHGVSFD